MPQSRAQGQYGSFELPPELRKARGAAYEEELRRKRTAIGQVYKSKERALSDQAARSGLLGHSGEVGHSQSMLASEQAAQEIGAIRDIEARRSGEDLAWAQGERGYQQELGKMGAGYGYQSQLLGQQQKGTAELEREKMELQRNLQSGKLSHDEQQRALDRLQQIEMQESQIGFGREGLESQERIAGGQQELGYAQITSHEQLAQMEDARVRELTAMGYTHEQALQQAQIESAQHMQQQGFGQEERMQQIQAELVRQGWSEEAARQEAGLQWEREKMYGPDYGGGGPGGMLGGGAGGGSYGGTYGLAQQELALKQQALEQSGQQFESRYGEGGYEERMAKTQYGYQRGLTNLQGDLATNLQTLQFNQANQAAAFQNFNDWFTLRLQGEIGDIDWQTAQNWVASYWDANWGDMPSSIWAKRDGGGA